MYQVSAFELIATARISENFEGNRPHSKEKASLKGFK